MELELEGYHQYWNYAVKKGYSGTAVFTKKEPQSVAYGIGIEEHDQEGRVITLEFEDFYFVTVYTPNSQNELARLDYRMKWEIDLKNLKNNRKNAGWRIDYFCVSETLKERLVDAKILTDITGSDHCPVVLEMN